MGYAIESWSRDMQYLRREYKVYTSMYINTSFLSEYSNEVCDEKGLYL